MLKTWRQLGNREIRLYLRSQKNAKVILVSKFATALFLPD